jgi:predicted ATPase/class 3 adenylate cyclase/DNA-binding winged helix-turn-helix (wHTH) protein
MLHLELLGPLRAIDEDGHDVTPAGQREREGLVTLAIVAPSPLSVERLAAELYRDRETSDPRNAVQAMISRLRRALGRSAGSVETTATGYRLVDVSLDVDQVEGVLQAARTKTASDQAAELLHQAAAGWRGPTLEGLDGDLIDGERLRIDNLWADTEEVVLERRLSAGGDPDLVAALEAVVAKDPLRERRWELLMLALYRQGRQAEALRAFQRARMVLSEQLGLDPGPNLAQLETRILAQDPALDDPTPAAPTRVSHDLPRGTVSVLLCDVEGSVRRWETAPADTARAVAELHRIWTEATEAQGGVAVKSTGDGVFSVFPTATRAVAAAAAGMARQTATDLLVKAAIHTGSLEPVDGDYRGPVVNRCSRLLDLAHGGQVLVSATTADLARLDLDSTASNDAAPLSLQDLGLHWLRDVPEPVGVAQVHGPGLRASFPPLRAVGPTSLPRLRNNLVGREDLTAEIVDKASTEVLVTLLGPGGIGKTSIAIAAGWELVGLRPVRFVDLGRISDPGAVADQMAEDLVVSDLDQDGDTVEQIIERLRTSTDLIIVDNAEHVLDAVTDIVDAALQHDIKGTFLVTSRRPLGLPDETIIGVPPLSVPGSDADLELTGRSPSVQLFLARARATGTQAEMANGLLPVVAHICRRLDGIPLAIELAAGRAALLSIDDIAARLDDQLRLLRQVSSSRERRHRSLEVVVGWSLDLLPPSARELFDRLSVMSGSFGLEGVGAVMANCGLDPDDALDDLDELQRASLLVVEPGGSRFRMLEPIRQAAQAELVDRGLELETRRAHARWMIELVTDAHTRRDATRAPALARIDAESDQLRAALTWVADAGQADLAAPLAFNSSWWFLTRDAQAGDRLMSRLLPLADREENPADWARLIIAVANTTAAHPHSDVQQTSLEAVAIFDELDLEDAAVARVAAALAQTAEPGFGSLLRLLAEADEMVSPDDRWARAIIDLTIMLIHGRSTAHDPLADSDPRDVIARGERACESLRDLGEHWALGITLGELGRIHFGLDDLEAAESAYVEALVLFTETKHNGSHYVMTELGRIASARSQHDRALVYHQQSLELALRDGTPGCHASSLAGLADAAVARGDREAAVYFYRQALELTGSSSIIEHGQPDWQRQLDALLTGTE